MGGVEGGGHTRLLSQKDPAILVPIAPFLRPTSPPVKTPPPVLIAPGPTPLPAEYFRTQDQSNLITFGAILLVLIILFSALSVLTAARKRKK